MTYLEELLFDCDKAKQLHVLLASPGGDGETAIRIVRAMLARCDGLTMLIPDMAKSAATLMCLGADSIVMGPGGDLGPVDPQFQIGGRSLASAKEIVAAIDEAESRVKDSPETFPLFAGLLADVNMLMVEQARSALARTGALVREALQSNPARTANDVERLTLALQAPLIDDPASHSAVISATAAQSFGCLLSKPTPHPQNGRSSGPCGPDTSPSAASLPVPSQPTREAVHRTSCHRRATSRSDLGSLRPEAFGCWTRLISAGAAVIRTRM